MIKTIIGALVGFFVWSVLWIGSDAVVKAVAPSIAPNPDGSNMTSAFLILKIVLSLFFSVAGGYISATVANERRQTPFVLGVLLFFFGLVVQVSYWNLFPFWYHLSLLLPLLPMSVLGARLRK